jgi:acylphosphatase
MQARITALVSGQVQGVGYRAFVRQQARDLGVTGYAENLADGRVEVVAEGHRADLDLLLVRMEVGPAHAAVADVHVEWGAAGGLTGFHVY